MLKLIRKLLCAALILLVGAGALLTLLGYGEYKALIKEKSLAAAAAESRAKASFTPLAELPDIYKDAVVAAEDHRFRLHFGIDPLGIARALMVDLRDGELKEGGSTITQQLIKNYYFPKRRDLVKKIAEAFLAVRMEKEFTKDEILELYVNSIYFGDGYYSVGEAAHGRPRKHHAGRHTERPVGIRADKEPRPRRATPRRGREKDARRGLRHRERGRRPRRGGIIKNARPIKLRMCIFY